MPELRTCNRIQYSDSVTSIHYRHHNVNKWINDGSACWQSCANLVPIIRTQYTGSGCMGPILVQYGGTMGAVNTNQCRTMLYTVVTMYARLIAISKR